MSKVQMLRALVKQRLTAAAEEIFGLFERTIEYEEELCRSKEENHRQRHLLDTVFNAERQTDVQQPGGCKEEIPAEQQDQDSILVQDNPDPTDIKEELKEADIIQFTLTRAPVKSEDDEEKPQSSTHIQRQTKAKPQASSSTGHMKAETDGEAHGGPESYTNSDPDTDCQPDEDKISECSEPETEVSDDEWKEMRGPQLGSKTLKVKETSVSDVELIKKPFTCSECGKRYGQKKNLKRHMKVHTGEKPFGCPICKKRFSFSQGFKNHMSIHMGEKPFSCLVCNKRFTERGNLNRHVRIHTGEKPFSCSICQKRFTCSTGVVSHMRSHTGERPYHCSVCDKGFTRKPYLIKHMSVHRREKTVQITD
ncbi:zinc finger and SCAN domain-containing protein 2-like [Thalassophryne amazonica]|uniref:zinc finger and SCAN domain-containing protein 2-like n=1 Tax=Thalassophryne amazonica TaxID=390379 RepID=UPI001471C841|nr:zinc finger and SCAN domain-containing protein 2-like [Thalassophryne amazonica]